MYFKLSLTQLFLGLELLLAPTFIELNEEGFYIDLRFRPFQTFWDTEMPFLCT